MIQKLKDNWAILLVIAAIFSGGGTFALGFDNLQQDVAANTTDRMLRVFHKLEAKGLRGKLSPREQVEFCNIAKHLGIGGPVVRKVC
mgnify:CR=1 FL=1|tara:strand:- start:274 stop:534 length:261 start_codon:yes stop_codon:yes gene_type:complete